MHKCVIGIHIVRRYFTVAIVPAAQALTMVSIRLKLMFQAIYLTDDLQWHPYTLFHALWNQGPVLLLRHGAVARILANGDAAFFESCAAIGWNDCEAPCGCSRTGPKSKLSPLLRSLWGIFRHLISLLTHFASMGLLAVGWVLRRGVNVGTITWLDVGYARDVECDLFRCGYEDRW